MTINNTTISNSLYPVANGTTSSNPFVDAFEARDPTTQDVNFDIQKKWLNTTTNTLWELRNFVSSQGVTTANWIKLGSAQLVESLTGNSGGAVSPVPVGSNNIFVVGDGTFITTVGNPATGTLLIEPAGGLATSYVEDTGTAVPSAGVLNVLGGTAIHTVGSGHTVTVDANIAQQAASSILANAGVASFNSASFTVDVNGFVSLSDSGAPIEKVNVDAHTAPGTNPVLPTSGAITVTGGQVAAGTTTNVIRTDSLAANTYTVEIQRSQAVASTTIGDNGVAHFDSAFFSVDANGFTSASSSFYSTGTWTPTLSFGGVSTGITYSVQQGTYERIGKTVTCMCYMVLTNKGAAAGTATISGLPFTATNALTPYAGIGPLAFNFLTLDGANTYTLMAVIANTATFQTFEYVSGSSGSVLSNTNYANNTTIGTTFTYFLP